MNNMVIVTLDKSNVVLTVNTRSVDLSWAPSLHPIDLLIDSYHIEGSFLILDRIHLNYIVFINFFICFRTIDLLTLTLDLITRI